MIPPNLTLSIIRYRSRVSGVNKGKELDLSLNLGVVAIEKGAFRSSPSTAVAQPTHFTYLVRAIILFLKMCKPINLLSITLVFTGFFWGFFFFCFVFCFFVKWHFNLDELFIVEVTLDEGKFVVLFNPLVGWGISRFFVFGKGISAESNVINVNGTRTCLFQDPRPAL